MTHITACIPFAREFVYCQFFISWAKMFAYSYGRYTMALSTCHGPYIDNNRDLLIREAKIMNTDYVLFLDDDQTYPEDTPERLLAHNKMVVGGVTPRKETCTPMVWDYIDDKITFWSSLREKTGLTKVNGMGMGGVLISMDVFKQIEYPYFKIHSSPTYQKHGEDMTFYFKCRDAGIDVWCDTDLQYGHMSMRELTLDDPPRKNP